MILNIVAQSVFKYKAHSQVKISIPALFLHDLIGYFQKSQQHRESTVGLLYVFYILISPSPVSASLSNPVRTLPYLFLIFFLTVVDSESHFSFSLILGTILNFSLLVVWFFFLQKNPFLFLSQKCLMFLFHCSGLTQTLPFERCTFLHSNALLGISMKSFDKNKTPSKTLLFLFSRKCSLHYLNSRLPVFCHFDCSGTKDRHGAWLGRDLT